MKVLQFAFSGDVSHPYLPHTYNQNSVLYTGTHDNDTKLGWYHITSQQERSAQHAYIGPIGE